MNVRRFLIALVAGAVLVAAAGCDSVRPFALKVNGTETSQSSVDRELDAIADNKALEESGQVTGEDGKINSEITAYWVTLLAEQEVIDREVKKRGLEVTAADTEAAKADIDTEFGAPVYDAFPKWLRDRLLRRYENRAVLVREIGGQAAGPTDEDIRAAYDEFITQQKAQCASGKFVAHILVATQEEADAAAAQLAAGADFATVARENSTDGSAGDGGELGCFDATQYIPEFATAADALSLGQVSAVVPTEFGFHLIRTSDTIAFEALEAGIRQQLEQQAGAQRNPTLDALVADTKVRVDPRYGTWKVQDGQGRVVPPEGAAPTTTAPVSPQPSP